MSFLSCSQAFIDVRSPSNIALVKYWGKKEKQIPLNPSLSMTLDQSYTRTKLTMAPGKSSWNEVLQFFFEGQEAPEFLPKLKSFLTHAQDKYKFLNQLSLLKIESHNSFPHSAGIASSASAFSALAFALEQIQAKIFHHSYNHKAASALARMGSGSACRSLGPGMQLWGSLDELGSDSYSVEVPYHPYFDRMKNSILIINSSQKKVGSSDGHALMNGHPFKEARIEQARENTLVSLKLLKSGDFKSLGEILEDEALTLHAMMLSSRPSFVLLEPNSLKAIECIRDYRKRTGLNVFFTIDAGPNLHVLYHESDYERLENELFVKLRSFCQDGVMINDQMGKGPEVLEFGFEE